MHENDVMDLASSLPQCLGEGVHKTPSKVQTPFLIWQKKYPLLRGLPPVKRRPRTELGVKGFKLSHAGAKSEYLATAQACGAPLSVDALPIIIYCQV